METPQEMLLQQTGILTRDYTEGQGVQCMRELLQAGATVVGSVGEAVEIISKIIILASGKP
jgi:hypothetical protein